MANDTESNKVSPLPWGFGRNQSKARPNGAWVWDAYAECVAECYDLEVAERIAQLANETIKLRAALEDIALSTYYCERDEMIDIAAEALGVEGVHRA